MACPVVNPEPCTWEGPEEECPEHGIGAYYRKGREKYGPEWNSGD